MIELLAPAKNYECGVAAINHGADAVYIAAQSFGAREAAGNSMKDIERLTKYAHRYFAKVYLVLNTILYENEIEPACAIIKQAYESGCDAAIIQDMGLLEAGLPPIPLFASTQTHNYTVEKVRFLESVGFQRVILARELSLQQIKDIRNHTTVDLESFVHGALCVSYSGQCYMSCAATGRSANRGACAQLCRLPYDLVDENGKMLANKKHLLSLHDLNLSAYLEQMMNAGISSFKIEGRLKDISYVKNITALYRKELDRLLVKSKDFKKQSSGNVQVNFEPDAQRSFSRGFTSYFINGRENKIASFNSPKSTGQYIGTVSTKTKNAFTLKSNVQLNNGDGICFIDNNGNMQGVRVNKVEGNMVFPLSVDGINVGTKIYRNYDIMFDKQLSSDNSAIRQINAKVDFKINEQQVIITVTDEDNVSVSLTTPQCGEPAQNTEKALANIKNQLSKTGGTLFKFADIIIDADKVYFYPAAQLNAWRRELIDLLEQERKKAYTQPAFGIEPNDIPYPENDLGYTANIANTLAEKFYKRHGVKNIKQAFEVDNNIDKPTLMFNRYCIKYEMGLCPNKQGAKPTGNLYLQHNNQRYKLIFDCKKCEMQIQKV